jgi:hypothetical protein
VKICFHCKECKPFTSFGKDTAKADGLKYICKMCMSVYRKAHPPSEKALQQTREYQRRNAKEAVVKRRAKRQLVKKNLAPMREKRKAERIANRPKVQLKSRMRIELGVEPPDDFIELLLVKFKLDKAIKERVYGKQ